MTAPTPGPVGMASQTQAAVVAQGQQVLLSIIQQRDSLLAENARLREAVRGLLLHVGGYRAVDFEPPQPLSWPRAVTLARATLAAARGTV